MSGHEHTFIVILFINKERQDVNFYQNVNRILCALYK